MLKRVLLLTTVTFLLACGPIGATAQEGLMMQQQPHIPQQQSEQERQLQRPQTPRRAVEDDIEDDDGMMGWRYGPGWIHRQKPSCKEPGDQLRSSRTNRSPNFLASTEE
jgi:hypothetical protein